MVNYIRLIRIRFVLRGSDLDPVFLDGLIRRVGSGSGLTSAGTATLISTNMLYK